MRYINLRFTLLTFYLANEISSIPGLVLNANDEVNPVS